MYFRTQSLQHAKSNVTLDLEFMGSSSQLATNQSKTEEVSSEHRSAKSAEQAKEIEEEQNHSKDSLMNVPPEEDTVAALYNNTEPEVPLHEVLKPDC